MRIVVAIAVITFILLFLYYSEFNTRSCFVGGVPYRVHKSYKDQGSAAETLAEINRRISVLKNYMKGKYAFLSEIRSGLEDFNMEERIMQFSQNYHPNRISEISPNNPLGSTSFTEGKGERIVFCLRDKETGKIHDINTLMFVALHEITHVMNEEWGHTITFWELFAIVLNDAVECGIYAPVDYSVHPKKYCGIKISSNPYYNFRIERV